MRSSAPVLLLLLCSLDPGQSQPRVPVRGSAPPQVPALWDELQGLKELVLSLKMEEVRRRQTLRGVESQLRDGEVEAETQRRSMEGLQKEVTQQIVELRRRVEEQEEQNKVQELLMLELQSRMNSSESSAEELRKRNSALASELPFLRTRLRASESTVEQLRRKNTVLASRLCSTETLLEELRGQMTEFLTSNSSSMVMIPDAAALQNLLDGRLEKLQARTEDQFSEMRLELNSSQILLDQLRRGVAAQAASVTQLQVRMNAAEELEDVHTETADEMSLMDLWRKLNRSESLQDQVNTVFTLRLNVTEQLLDELQTESAVRAADLRSVSDGLTDAQEELQVRLGAVAAAVEELNTEGGEELRVGFSAGLTDSGVVGPFDQETTLVFSKTIINVGHAYNHLQVFSRLLSEAFTSSASRRQTT
ncbi:hypothetical protein FQA47_003507 [Oryzias melastigma]|uniref:Uncharacterized protein n=1 Tax=Oryzias melastigma TaxID=30732 RepID=A0A834C1Q1_ORYME|nr:hypothetical protein FQA47_003507 [Oryzias melastigma]